MIPKEKYGETVDKDQLMIYVDQDIRNYAGANLMLFGLEMYYYSYLKKNLHLYTGFIDMSSDERSKWLLELSINDLTTNFTMCTIFENYMKAKLLFNNCIVHLFKDNRRKKQTENVCTYFKDPAPTIEGVKQDLLPDRTIGLRLLLSEPYQKIIALPKPILDLLNHIREPRNTLHFQSSAHFTTSISIVEGIKAVDEFITVFMKKQLQDMYGINPNDYK